MLHKDEWRKTFSVYENAITGLYEASKPEILGKPVVRAVAIFQYLRGVIDSIIQQEDIESAARKVSELLDESLVVDASGFGKLKESGTAFKIQQKGKTWDLSKVDFDKLNEDFRKATYKNIEIADLRAFWEKKLQEMLNKNSTRRDLAERLQDITDDYNAGSSSADFDFAELMKFGQGLKMEEERHIKKGLTEDELEIYDLFCKEKMTQEEEKKVRLAAKALLKRLATNSPGCSCRIGIKTAKAALPFVMKSERCSTNIFQKATTAPYLPRSVRRSSNSHWIWPLTGKGGPLSRRLSVINNGDQEI